MATRRPITNTMRSAMDTSPVSAPRAASCTRQLAGPIGTGLQCGEIVAGLTAAVIYGQAEKLFDLFCRQHSCNFRRCYQGKPRLAEYTSAHTLSTSCTSL